MIVIIVANTSETAFSGGLFFCNAIEHMKRECGTTDVEVVCYEKSSQPGGVWRAGDATTTDMYDKLWSNGASHCLEFFDYTFDEAFGKPVPVYLKRQELHNYIIGRVQKNCKDDFFEKYVRFMHSVEHVSFDNAIGQFRLKVKDLENHVVSTHSYDKCIWACGENGTKIMPEKTVQMFRDGGFTGPIMHSSDAADATLFEKSVAGKRILLIGGGYSAEDLALQAIKVGVDRVFVCSRGSYSNEISYTKHWPGDKVEHLPFQVPFLVINNGTCIQFHEVEWSLNGYKRVGGVETKLRNIDTVIFCTGYDVNLSMLDQELKQGFPKHSYTATETLEVPKDWKMPEGPLTAYTGDIPLADKIQYICDAVHPRFYNGVLISNPNMMFLTVYASEYPLLSCDSYAWLFAGYITGRVQMPSVEEMKLRNQKEALSELGMSYSRYLMDENYCKAVEALDIWPEEYGERSIPWDECEMEWVQDQMNRMAAIFYEAKYPFQIGTREKLNKEGQTLLDFGMLDYYNRRDLKPSEDEKDWRTFRDDPHPEKFFSLFTGTKAVPLEDRWMNIDR